MSDDYVSSTSRFSGQISYMRIDIDVATTADYLISPEERMRVAMAPPVTTGVFGITLCRADGLGVGRFVLGT